MAQGTPLFDPATFLETKYDGGLDTTYVLCDEGDYTAQTTDKLTLRSGKVAEGDYAGNAWANLEIQWEIQDERQKKRMNVDTVLVRQSFMLDLDQKAFRERGAVILDFGVNRNMRIKRFLDATGLNSVKNWNFNMFKHLPGFVTVTHRRIDGFDDPVAEVTRVTSLKKARAAGREAA